MKNTTHWPLCVPQHLELPKTSLYDNLMISALRYPDRHAVIFYGKVLSYERLKQQVDQLAGFLQHKCHIAKGDHIALYMQNCPQFIIAYYAVVRTGGIVVPISAMNLQGEVSHIIRDCRCSVILYGQELSGQVIQLQEDVLAYRVAATYSDYIDLDTDLPLDDILTAPRTATPGRVHTTYSWQEALDHNLAPIPVKINSEDLAVLPYTSGTTGLPKGCVHTHRSVMHTVMASLEWCKSPANNIIFAALPMFHVSGMQYGINIPIYASNTIVIMSRWNKQCAAQLIERYRVTAWSAISTMLCDFLNQPDLDHYDLSSLRMLTGGGAAMPKAVAQRIQTLWGIDYIEGYGLTETMAPTHINPVHRSKPQCLGIPISDTESIVIDPETRQELPRGSVGEILVSGPQVFLGYHNNAKASAEAFVQINSQRYFRTGDLGYIDDEGYFFMVDRLKRMINAAGYKVWPAEVELLLYDHPAVLEACVIGCIDSYRGESVKAVVVRRVDHEMDESSLIAWAQKKMAAYKVPRVVEFVESLPKSSTGKLQWRVLQDEENSGST